MSVSKTKYQHSASDGSVAPQHPLNESRFKEHLEYQLAMVERRRLRDEAVEQRRLIEKLAVAAVSSQETDSHRRVAALEEAVGAMQIAHKYLGGRVDELESDVAEMYDAEQDKAARIDALLARTEHSHKSCDDATGNCRKRPASAAAAHVIAQPDCKARLADMAARLERSEKTRKALQAEVQALRTTVAKCSAQPAPQLASHPKRQEEPRQTQQHQQTQQPQQPQQEGHSQQTEPQSDQLQPPPAPKSSQTPSMPGGDAGEAAPSAVATPVAEIAPHSEPEPATEPQPVAPAIKARFFY